MTVTPGGRWPTGGVRAACEPICSRRRSRMRGSPDSVLRGAGVEDPADDEDDRRNRHEADAGGRTEPGQSAAGPSTLRGIGLPVEERAEEGKRDSGSERQEREASDRCTQPGWRAVRLAHRPSVDRMRRERPSPVSRSRSGTGEAPSFRTRTGSLSCRERQQPSRMERASPAYRFGRMRRFDNRQRVPRNADSSAPGSRPFGTKNLRPSMEGVVSECDELH